MRGRADPHTLDCLRELAIELTVPHALVHRATARIPRGEVRYSDRDLCAVVRRSEFDALLAAHASRAGVELRQDEKVLEVRRDGGTIRVLTDRGEIRPRVLVGADGSGSIVHRRVFGAEQETIGRAVMCDLRAADVGGFDAERYVFDFGAVPHGLRGYLWSSRAGSVASSTSISGPMRSTAASSFLCRRWFVGARESSASNRLASKRFQSGGTTGARRSARPACCWSAMRQAAIP